MSARVSVVLVEDTGVRRTGRLASVCVDVDEQMLVGVACPAGVAECMDDVMLQMMSGTMFPSDIAEQVADDTASIYIYIYIFIYFVLIYTENIQQIRKNTTIVPITWSPGWSERTVQVSY